jgi:hypothetical protein
MAIDPTQLPRLDRIKRASIAYHAGQEIEDPEALQWLEDLLIDMEMIQLFNGSLQSYEALNRPFVEDVRAVIVGKRDAERKAKATRGIIPFNEGMTL